MAEYDRDTNTDLLFVTLEKSEKHYSADHAVQGLRDLAPPLSLGVAEDHRREFHGSAVHPPRERGSSRNPVRPPSNKGRRRTVPYSFLGPCRYESHTGDRPMGIIWRLARDITADLYAEARSAAG